MDRRRATPSERLVNGATAGSTSPFEQITDHRRTLLANALLLTSTHDRAAFREVYCLTSAKLFGICLMICGERPGAEDVLQEVYLKVWRHAGAWEPDRGAAITWLAAIARNQAIDWRRRKILSLATPLDDAPDIPDPSPCAETRLLFRETSDLLSTFLSILDPPVRDAIGAAFFQGLTYAELAERNGVPLGTMKSRIRRGLARLREQFDIAEQKSSFSSGATTNLSEIKWAF